MVALALVSDLLILLNGSCRLMTRPPDLGVMISGLTRSSLPLP